MSTKGKFIFFGVIFLLAVAAFLLEPYYRYQEDPWIPPATLTAQAWEQTSERSESRFAAAQPRNTATAVPTAATQAASVQPQNPPTAVATLSAIPMAADPVEAGNPVCSGLEGWQAALLGAEHPLAEGRNLRITEIIGVEVLASPDRDQDIAVWWMPNRPRLATGNLPETGGRQVLQYPEYQLTVSECGGLYLFTEEPILPLSVSAPELVQLFTGSFSLQSGVHVILHPYDQEPYMTMFSPDYDNILGTALLPPSPLMRTITYTIDGAQHQFSVAYIEGEGYFYGDSDCPYPADRCPVAATSQSVQGWHEFSYGIGFVPGAAIGIVVDELVLVIGDENGAQTYDYPLPGEGQQVVVKYFALGEDQGVLVKQKDGELYWIETQ
ncbi:hypothetical protein A2Z33_05435 [Candidatus Gottesmanbacteria bacterium RBG_16_52_11]|uniref:Uncharacterized protein n=1 Tax=Candidatus Gottesmanbacteria bacterium RBG_16_52_11 TaxID=1798374 RepID=A0A1F5YWE7_9BACT|nr:MAG: hypothetical protein A2Z33_05435 [Candidatus Gottesmanbacteria bacterium RBG_16_52_11]